MFNAPQKTEVSSTNNLVFDDSSSASTFRYIKNNKDL